MQEAQDTWLQSLDQEDPLKKEMAIHSSILVWEITGTEEPWTEPATVHGVTKVGHNLVTQQQKAP